MLKKNSPKSAYSSKTISRDLLLGLILLVVLVTACAELFYSIRSSHRSMEKMNQYAEGLTQELSLMLAIPLYNIDSQSIQHVATTYTQIPDVRGVRVVNEENKVVFDTIGEKRPDILLEHTVSYKDLVLGKVFLGLTDQYYKQHRRNTQLLIIALGLACIVTMAIGIVIIMHYILTRPLQQFNEGLNKIAEGDYSTRLPSATHSDLNASIQAVNRLASHINNVVGELSLTSEFLTNVLNSMPSIIIGIDSRWSITKLNKAAKEKAGVEDEGYQGQPFADIFPGLDDATVNTVRQAMAENKTISAERKCQLLGDRQYGAVTVYPLHGRGDSDTGAVIRIDDITDRIRLHEIMVQTEKMMSVGGLGAGMAHEINNPLGGILQATQNIERRLSSDLPDNRKAAERYGFSMASLQAYMEERQILSMLSGIRESGKRAAQIVQNMLQFSRRNDSTMESHHLAELLDRAIELAGNDYNLKRKYDFRNVTIVRRYNPDIMIFCARNELEQVFLNLLKNAAQSFGSTGIKREQHPQIIICSSVDNEYVTVEVTDNGPGIDAEAKKRIFEPYFTTKKVGEGTGLGLAVCFFIVVDQHNGVLSADSLPGQGTTFTVKIPVR